MAYEELKLLGQSRLDAFVEIAFGANLWSIQRQVALALSKPRARVAVPSCNASGKSFLAGALALAFYCVFPDSKVITTSSKFEHLRDALWGEIRRHYTNARVPIPGKLLPGGLRLDNGPQHFIRGHSPNSHESFQGYHAPYKLIIADEATFVDEDLASGINGLLASGDTRLLLIFNPTSDDTWAAEQTRNPDFEVIKITAFDTPHFTGESIPPNSNLVTPAFLDTLKSQGMGPGSVEWTTRVEANFWQAHETQLILPVWYEKALVVPPYPGPLVFGIDLAPYGDSENAIAWRRGNCLEKIEAFPAMRPDLFWQGHVFPRAHEHKPRLGIYDADGVGAGSVGDAESALGKTVAHPFRGGIAVGPSHRNLRSLWWWMLRRAFQREEISILHDDPTLKKQLTSIRYGFTETGAIKIESKENMRKRGVSSPDRADAMMYAFSIEPLTPALPDPDPRTDEGIWKRTIDQVESHKASKEVNPILATSDY